MAATSYHWALHPWAIYAVVALALALFTYNKRPAADAALGLLPDPRRTRLGLVGPHHRHRSPCSPRCSAWPRHLASARSRRMAGSQPHVRHPRAGEQARRCCSSSASPRIALVSVLRGLDGGVKVLSEINMGHGGVLLLLFVIFVGQRATILTDLLRRRGLR
jgi:BCCT family betaine/carnitine transporter